MRQTKGRVHFFANAYLFKTASANVFVLGVKESIYLVHQNFKYSTQQCNSTGNIFLRFERIQAKELAILFRRFIAVHCVANSNFGWTKDVDQRKFHKRYPRFLKKNYPSPHTFSPDLRYLLFGLCRVVSVVLFSIPILSTRNRLSEEQGFSI